MLTFLVILLACQSQVLDGTPGHSGGHTSIKILSHSTCTAVNQPPLRRNCGNLDKEKSDHCENLA